MRTMTWWRAEVRSDGSVASLVEAGPAAADAVSVRYVVADTREMAAARVATGFPRCTVRNAELAIETVCAVTGAKPDILLGESRKPAASHARHLLATILREVLGASYPEIGIVMHRDHTTAMSSVSRLQAMLAVDQRDSRNLYQTCEERLRAAIEERAAGRAAA